MARDKLIYKSAALNICYRCKPLSPRTASHA